MKQKWHRVYLGIGSNLGNRLKNINGALLYLNKEKKIKIVKTSPFYETKPEGGPQQSNFLNGAVYIKTKEEPLALLKILKKIERRLGRKKSQIRWSPRPIDLDILLYDDLLFENKKLTIPHPLMTERLFVILPLADIAPRLKHPISKKSIRKTIEILKKNEKALSPRKR